MNIDEIRARLQKIPEPPYFVTFDEAEDTTDHKNSGLAKVDTGREMDWPIARLCEWPTAEFIAHAPEDLQFLLARLETAEALLKRAKMFIEYARYELEPGLSVFPDQFPKQQDADKEIASIAEYFSESGKGE